MFLNWANSGERPAAAAPALVLNRTNSSFSSPINGGKLSLFEELLFLLRIYLRCTFITKEHGLELLFGEVGELVQANSISSTVLAVLLSHKAQALGKDLLTSLVLFLGSIALSMLSEIARESGVQ